MTSKLSKTVLAALALLAAPVAAQAADLSYKGPPPAPVAYYNWTGFYAGINGGYASGTSNWTALPINNEPSGGLIGATLGYNFQAGALVYGLEGDWAWSTVDNSTACGLGACESKQSWFGTARGRIGYAFDRLMPYLTGGAAFANLKAGITPGFGTVSSTEIGWTAGVGFEYGFLGNWSAKIEYLYADLGTFPCGTPCGVTVPNDVSFKENVIRAGLNYRFAGPIYSRY